MEKQTGHFPEGAKKFARDALTKIFPQEQAESSWNLGIIAIHGNEPQRIVTAIAMEINDILREHGLKGSSIVLPDIYGEESKRILREEFPDNLDQIFISDELGRILKQTEFSSADYRDHMQEVAENQPKVYNQVLEFLSRSFAATSLSGHTQEFSPSGRRLEINAGANVVASKPGKKVTHFYFPVVLSELVQGILEDDGINSTYDLQALETVLRYALDFESTYLTTQLGYVHTFSFKLDYDTRGKILTPPPKKFKTPPDLSIENGIYVMASGSGIGVDVVTNQAKLLSAQGYQIVAPGWMKLEFAITASPEAIFHPGVKAVIGRAGWGILWDAQKAQKPFGDIGSGEYDNPEIRFNRRSIIKAGVGDAFSIEQGFIEHLVELSPNIENLNRQIERDLNLPANYDGTHFAAENILEAEITKLP